MKIFVMANPKGGSGKSSTCLSLALAFAEAQVKIAILDLDNRQLSSWSHGQALGLPVFRKGDDLPECQVLLIDTAGYFESSELAAACDYVRDPSMGRIIVPMQANFMDFDATLKALEPLRLPSNPAARLLFTRIKKTSSLAKQRDKFAARVGLPVLNSVMTERPCYQSAVRAGWSALTDEAQAELNALKTELLL